MSHDGDNSLINDRRDFIAAEAKAEPMSDKGWQHPANEIDSWWSDSPITDRQLEVIQGDLDNESLPEGWRVHPQVVRKLVAEAKRLRAQLAEIGEMREEWRFDDGMGKFTVKLTPLSDADVRYLRQQTERPVEHRFVGDWRDTVASAQGDATEGEDG